MKRETESSLRAWVDWLFDEGKRSKAAMMLFGAALLVRLVALLLLPEAHLSSNAKTAILGGAALIRSGEFIANPYFPTLVPPLGALFAFAVQSVFGDSLFPIKLVQVLLDAVTVVVVFSIGRLIFPYVAATIGAAMLVFYPFTVFASLYIGTEALFTFFLSVFVLSSIRAIKEERAVLFLVAGVSLGLATLTRGTTQYFPLFFLAFLGWYYRGLGPKILKYGVAFVLGFVLLVGPWTARNILVLDSFVMASTPGMPLLYGSSEEFWFIDDRRREIPRYYEYLRNEKGITVPDNPHWGEKDRFYRQAAREKYRERWEERPASFFTYYVKKFFGLWYFTETGRNQWMILLVNVPIYVFGGYGLWCLLRQRNRLGWFVIMLLSYFVAVHLAVSVMFRYAVPVMPYIVLFASFGAVQLVYGRLVLVVARYGGRLGNDRERVQLSK